jgi:hypothetical protein
MRRCDSSVVESFCGPPTFGLGQQIVVPLAGDLEMNG